MNVESGRPHIDLGALRKQTPRDYLVRFAFGAAISTIAGVAALVLGPRLGGVLLAFPAILPASLTLIERKSDRREAAVDATGAIIGSIGLVVFALTASWGLPRLDPFLSVGLAGALWAVVAVSLYAALVRLRRRNMDGKTRTKATM